MPAPTSDANLTDSAGAPLVKVTFLLEPEDEDWPPFTAESLWAYDLGNGNYRLDNVPFYAPNVAVDDVVAASEQDGRLVVTNTVTKSEHLTLRLIVLTNGPLAGDVTAAVDAFRALGTYVEQGDNRMIALDIGPGSDLANIRRVLAAGEENGSWGYEEGRVNDAWRAVDR